MGMVLECDALSTTLQPREAKLHASFAALGRNMTGRRATDAERVSIPRIAALLLHACPGEHGKAEAFGAWARSWSESSASVWWYRGGPCAISPPYAIMSPGMRCYSR